MENNCDSGDLNTTADFLTNSLCKTKTTGMRQQLKHLSWVLYFWCPIFYLLVCTIIILVFYIYIYNMYDMIISSVQFSCSLMSDSLWPHGLQHARPPCPSPTPGVYWNLCPWVSEIQPSHLLSSPSPPTFNLSQHHGLFKWVSSSHQVANVLEFQLQHQFFQWLFRTDIL